ncbi:Polyisoprenoid-binding protein YceI [Chitinophaga terrae (ex Kim and Jung 2007)]|uniref:Polyisoprenoid-binding protein YceI n=1 Tax=Chitinophaga terrae (ex Kim and Jung 2007) TaxID=408074 RepID=A0A1H4EWQ4_9BACT|nr:YceI family protein [Chitinophaga terrae (ex Kim and Jung 2007)]GEP90680.1 lipid-binding protein [Chitinophaga terrae (ex Kim and Jung 2007)]SEA89484.1 Polyisoprenoid-binding protein YceI [Chitinophaga terrae (ex Kim and Jung 2007)]
MNTQIFNIVNAQSNIEWVGRKVTGAHNGTIDIQSGSLTLTDGQVTAGSFVIDVASIKILDVTDPATNAQFAGHLASDDFFGTDKYPEAYFEITSARGNHVTGNLTIKGITHPVEFNITVAVNNDTLSASAKIVVDRTLYDIKFRSGNFFQNLGDTLIYNDFDLNVSLTAKAALQTA